MNGNDIYKYKIHKQERMKGTGTRESGEGCEEGMNMENETRKYIAGKRINYAGNKHSNF